MSETETDGNEGGQEGESQPGVVQLDPTRQFQGHKFQVSNEA